MTEICNIKNIVIIHADYDKYENADSPNENSNTSFSELKNKNENENDDEDNDEEIEKEYERRKIEEDDEEEEEGEESRDIAEFEEHSLGNKKIVTSVKVQNFKFLSTHFHFFIFYFRLY